MVLNKVPNTGDLYGSALAYDHYVSWAAFGSESDIQKAYPSASVQTANGGTKSFNAKAATLSTDGTANAISEAALGARAQQLRNAVSVVTLIWAVNGNVRFMDANMEIGYSRNLIHDGDGIVAIQATDGRFRVDDNNGTDTDVDIEDDLNVGENAYKTTISIDGINERCDLWIDRQPFIDSPNATINTTPKNNGDPFELGPSIGIEVGSDSDGSEEVDAIGGRYSVLHRRPG